MTTTIYAPEEQKTTRPQPGSREMAASERTLGEDAVPAPGHRTSHLPGDIRQINGWGADLNPADRPSYPRELPSEVMTVRGDVKHWQTPTTKIYVSNEHPGITPVFGESCPSHGLAGYLRDYAYQFGEGTNRRWMTLMMANRVDVVENAIGDLLRGRPDNYIKEKGWTAFLKYPESKKQNWMLVAGAVIGIVGVGLLMNSRKS